MLGELYPAFCFVSKTREVQILIQDMFFATILPGREVWCLVIDDVVLKCFNTSM